MTEFVHIPVMLEECIEGLDIKPDGIYLDGTLGGGGHSLEIVKRLTTGRLVANDLDLEAIAAAKQKLIAYQDKISFIHGDYKDILSELDDMGINELDGILLDLGISSYQIDNPERGFSYIKDARLDMRMNAEQSLSAYEVINEYGEEELSKIFFDYGEEKLSRRIAARIIENRKKKPIETTAELASIVERCYPAATRFKFGHPAKRVFQAVRIEVNGELEGLGKFIEKAALRLKKGGRICVMTFHSLEDRIVKNVIKELEKDCICDKSFPVCVCNKRREVISITNKPAVASANELKDNKRAESAKLRIAERV